MKSVLVTGGRTRLGREIADFLRAEGWRVLTTSHRPDTGADLVADFTDPEAADHCFEAACRLLNGEPPTALVNNAALFRGAASDLKAVNADAPQRLTELMASQQRSTRGVVVNILDARILKTVRTELRPAEADYVETKRALLEATRRDAVRFAATLRVNAVAPGPVLAPVGVHEKAGETLVGRPSAAEVARAVSFLLSASATTGVIIPVDGGQHLC